MTVATRDMTTIYQARKGPRPMTPEDMWSIPRVGVPSPSPDGNACAVSVSTYDLETNEAKGRIWLVPTAAGRARALTAPEASSTEPAFSPDGTQLAFVRKDANGKGQLHLMPLDGGEARRVTDLPLGVFDPRWLPNGKGIVFGAQLIKDHLTPAKTRTEIERREKDPVKAHVTEERFFRYWDTWLTTGEVPHLFHLDVATEKVRDLTPSSTTWFDWLHLSGQYDISPDGKEIAFAGVSFQEDRVRSAIYTVPVAGGKITCLTPDHPANDNGPRYSPDGKTIVYGMQEDPFYYADQTRIMAYDRAGGTHTRLIDNWDFSPHAWVFGEEGALYLHTEIKARMGIFVWRGSGTPELLVSHGTVTGVETVKNELYFTLSTLNDPGEVHVCNGDGKNLRKRSSFTAEAAARYGVGEVREMTFDGAYGEPVQMFVVLPADYQEGKQYPLVQLVHGGPHGVSPDAFGFRWNPHLFSSPGYISTLVNFQGSTGWGQDYAKRIQGSWGDRPYQDVMLGTNVIVGTGMIDESKMAAAGGSYGGYMAAWIAGHTDRFKCIINHAGVYNTLSHFSTDWTFGRGRSFGGDPWDGLAGIDKWNPARFAAGFETPMLVIHGERDYRVPITQGLECYNVLKAKGVDARLVYYPDENHWILKPQNSLLWYREVLGWLERYLV